jgi:hypothetical protein
MVADLGAVIPEIASTDKGTYVTQKGLEVANALETLQLAERLFEDLMTYVTHKQAVFVIIRALKAMVRGGGAAAGTACGGACLLATMAACKPCRAGWCLPAERSVQKRFHLALWPCLGTADLATFAVVTGQSNQAPLLLLLLQKNTRRGAQLTDYGAIAQLKAIGGPVTDAVA